jgi:hypothetical protein
MAALSVPKTLLDSAINAVFPPAAPLEANALYSVLAYALLLKFLSIAVMSFHYSTNCNELIISS